MQVSDLVRISERQNLVFYNKSLHNLVTISKQGIDTCINIISISGIQLNERIVPLGIIGDH